MDAAVQGKQALEPRSVATALKRFSQGHAFAAEILQRAEVVVSRLEPQPNSSGAGGRDAANKPEPSNGVVVDLDAAHDRMADLLNKLSGAVDRIQQLIG